jgi:hypothetical protein
MAVERVHDVMTGEMQFQLGAWGVESVESVDGRVSRLSVEAKVVVEVVVEVVVVVVDGPRIAGMWDDEDER